MNAHPQFSEDSASADQASPQVPPPPRLLRLPEVIDRVGLPRSAIYHRMTVPPRYHFLYCHSSRHH